MSSEIRVNSLSSRAGLSTVTFTDTGPIFSGITTFQDNSGFNVGTGGSIFSPASNTVTLGTNSAERLRIDAAGRLLLGTTTEGEANADDLTIATSAHTGMTIRSGTANRGNIYFSDGTSGDAEYRGYVTYDHDGDKFKFGTANADRFVITSAGKIGFGVGSPSEMMEITNTGGTGTQIQLRDTSTGTGAGDGLRIGYNGSGGQMWNFENTFIRFATNNNERMRLTNDGHVLIGGQTEYTYDDTGNSNTILDVVNGDNNKRGILSLSGNTNGSSSIGTIWFNNDQNASQSPGSTMKLCAAIQAQAVTSDSNAGDDAGARLQFMTKNEAGSLTERFRITAAGNVEPAADDTYNLGSSSLRWANLYTGDLNLSNEGSSNDVDGTWGNYTIQEGEDDLFLINRRNGKTYKFNLTEV